MFKPLVWSALLLLGACAQLPQTPAEYQSKLRLEDDKVYVQRLHEDLLSDGSLKVGVVAASVVPFEQTVRYRTHWYDAADIPVQTVLSNWNTLKVSGNAPFEFVIVGPGSRAKRYVIEIETN